MDKWINGQTDRQKKVNILMVLDRQIEKKDSYLQIERRINNEYLNRGIDIYKDGQMNGWIDRWMY